MRLIIILLLIVPPSHAGDFYLNLGLWSEHYAGDKPEYNEDSELIQLTYRNNSLVALATSFKTSHYKPALSLGIGKEWRVLDEVTLGIVPSIVDGYQDDITSNCGNYLCVPLFTAKYSYFKANIGHPAINIGFEFPL